MKFESRYLYGESIEYIVTFSFDELINILPCLNVASDELSDELGRLLKSEDWYNVQMRAHELNILDKLRMRFKEYIDAVDVDLPFPEDF